MDGQETFNLFHYNMWAPGRHQVPFHHPAHRRRRRPCGVNQLGAAREQIEDVDDAVTCLHCDMESPDELEARRRGLRQASQVQVACNCRLRAAEQPGSLQCACSRTASAYSAPKGTFCATA